MHRLNNGKPIREAITEAGLTLHQLSEKTRQVDPGGYGVAVSTLGHMVSQGTSGRSAFRRRSCDLIAAALGKPVTNLFTDNPPT